MSDIEKYMLSDEEIIKAHEGELCRDCGKFIACVQLIHAEPLIRAEGIKEGRRQVITHVNGMIHISVIDQDRYSIIDMLKFSELFKELEG